MTDVVPHTSVGSKTLSFDVTVANYGAAPVSITLSGSLSAAATTATSQAGKAGKAKAGRARGVGRALPLFPTTEVAVGAGSSRTVSITGMAWELGEESFWWPNKPCSEDYTPALFVLALKARAQAPAPAATATASRRFGFVEWGEAGGNGTWYTVNGRRINLISDATPEAAMSQYDCYTTSEAFGTLEGAKETFRRYMRLGLSANRIHQSTPTQVMLDAADEVRVAGRSISPPWG